MRKRRSRKNAFWGRPRLHSKAARKGWGRRRARRSRRNAGAMSLVKNTTRSLGAGFQGKVLKRAGTILGGNVLTTWSEGMIASRVPFLRSHPIAEVFSLFVLAGAASVVAAKTAVRKYVSPADILIGGMLAGITRGAKLLFPGSFATCGLGEDLEGMDGWFANPHNIGTAFPLLNGYAGPHALAQGVREGIAGMGWAPGPGNPTIGTSGMNDYAQLYQTQAPTVITALDGMAANAEVSHEIGMQM